MISGILRKIEDKKVTIVGNRLNSPWASSVTCCLRANGYAVSLSTLEEAPPKDEDLIFLLDLDTPFVHNLGEHSFLQLQQYFLRMTGRGIWVTHSTQLTCQDPRYGLIYGLARTLRIEYELDISIFETQHFDDESANALFRVLEKIKSSRDNEQLDPEYEFSYQDRVTHIGRCHWPVPAKGEEKTPEVNDSSAIKLDVGTYGLLDTLQWSEVADTKLNLDEVEVEICYVGLNFRVILHFPLMIHAYSLFERTFWYH